MKPPRKLDVGPATFKVRKSELGGELLGVTRPTDLQILYAEGQAAMVLADTLLHEALHACIAVHGIDVGDHDNEERLVRALAPALLALVRDNPTLMGFLCQPR